MQRVAQFEKVKLSRFMLDWLDAYNGYEDEKEIKEITLCNIYSAIKLPARATSGSAGYDFYAPSDYILNPGESIVIPTGIKCKMSDNWVLKLYPRSGLGFKYRLQLNNTVGIIDSDYYYSSNEGHIMCKLTNDSREGKTVEIKKATGFVQGIFLEYGITMDDDAKGVRDGGFGSTDK